MKFHELIDRFLLLLKGCIVGFGAIMPGISGGTLCVVFGMYRPIMEVFSSPRKYLRRHWKIILIFVAGAGIGFVGLSGLAGWLMKKNSWAVTCAFIGFILGTVPELWQDAGREGRRPASYGALAAGFVVMLALLLFLKHQQAMTLAPNFWGFLLCGVLWGISFIVPGLSSSTLLLFFGLYQPMLEGIARFSLPVLLPMALGVGITLLTLPKIVNAAYKKYYMAISHVILGIILATTVMIFPVFPSAGGEIALYIGCILGGAIASYGFSRLCARLKNVENPSKDG